MHVVKTQCIWREFSSLICGMKIEAARFLAKRVLAVEVCHINCQCFAEAEWCTCPCTTGIFPLCFTRQVKVLSCHFGESLAELLSVTPGDSLYRQIIAFESAWRKFSHHGFPLFLCDKKFSHHE